jgi:hypothetical protein
MNEIICEWYNKYSEKREEAFHLRLILIEIKHELELTKLGYRQMDDVIEKIQNELNK